MSEGILQMIQSFESHATLNPTGKEDFFGIEDILYLDGVKFTKT